MKLGKDVLLEIVAIVQEGISTMTDISEKLRDIDVVTLPMSPGMCDHELTLTLSEDYKKRKGA